MKRVFALTLCLLLFSFFSCDKDGGEIVSMIIASEKGIMHDGESGLDIPVLLGKIGKSEKWELIGSIDGFEFEEGYECVLTVAIIPVKNPPAGGSGLRYKMLRLLSKTEKDSEGL